MNNIPYGYDENGVRAGVGHWSELGCRVGGGEVEEIDRIDELGRCEECGKVIDKGHRLCEQCSLELGLDI